MFYKKLIAVAIATSFSAGALAQVNLDDTTADAVTIANESFVATIAGDLNTDGRLVVTNSGALDILAEVGFTVGQNTSRFVRVDLTNGVFNATPVLTTNGDASVAPDFSASISEAGAAGDDYVIFEVTDPTEDILPDDVFTISAASYAVDPSATTSVQYRLYETGAGAVNELVSALLEDKQEAAVEFATSLTGTITTEGEAVALVGNNFTAYDGGLGEVGVIDHDLLLATGTFLKPDLTPWTADDFISGAQTATFTGDFSFGTWALDSDGDCADVANRTAVTPTVGATDTGALSTSLDFTAANYALCSTIVLDTDTALKGSYSVELTTDEYTGTVGKVTYDTTSVEIPYLTTFGNYVQRIYIVNDGPAAAYQFTFNSEAGVVETPLAASGIAAANSVTMLLATDIVSLTGKTRTSAVLEIEATDADIAVSTQIVNVKDGDAGTDTIILN